MELQDYILASAKNDELLEQLQQQQITPEQQQKIDEAANLKAKVIAILKTVCDPEIPVNIWDLGLVYDLRVDENLKQVEIDMTLTAPTCPVAGAMPVEVEKRVRKFVADFEVEVKLVWQPPWSKEMMSEDAKLILDLW